MTQIVGFSPLSVVVSSVAVLIATLEGSFVWNKRPTTEVDHDLDDYDYAASESKGPQRCLFDKISVGNPDKSVNVFQTIDDNLLPWLNRATSWTNPPSTQPIRSYC